jgi:hypothetical protein
MHSTTSGKVRLARTNTGNQQFVFLWGMVEVALEGKEGFIEVALSPEIDIVASIGQDLFIQSGKGKLTRFLKFFHRCMEGRGDRGET